MKGEVGMVDDGDKKTVKAEWLKQSEHSPIFSGA